MKKFYIIPKGVHMDDARPLKYHGHVLDMPFESLDQAVDYWVDQLAQYEGSEIDKRKAYIRTLFDARPGYMGHPECDQAPDLSIEVEKRRKHWKSLEFGEIEESLMDPMHIYDTDPCDCRLCCWPLDWEESLSPGAVKFIDPYELDYQDKPRYKQLKQQVNDYLQLAREVERFWSRNDGYFKKVKWYKQRKETPPFAPLQNPFCGV